MSDTARPKTAGDLLTANEINQDLPILGVAGETINGATLPVAVLSGSDIYTNSEKITQTSQNGSESLYGANWKAQTFLTDADTNRITSITLYLKKTLAPTGNFEIELFAVDGSNKPTGSALGNVTKTCASITTSYVLYNFEFSSPVAVDPSTTYAFVIKATSGDASNFVQYYRTNATVYADGGLTISADSGASWGSVSATTDLYFKLFGGFLLTDGRFYACEADNIDKLDFIGFVIDDVVAGDSTLFQKNGVVSGFTGLSIGYKYYIQDDKTIGTTPGTYVVLVGFAISSTEILIYIFNDKDTQFKAGELVFSEQNDNASPANTTIDNLQLWKDIVVGKGGTFRIKFSQNAGSGSVWGKIYRNGVAVGTLRSGSGTFEEDISGWNAGDAIELYAGMTIISGTTPTQSTFQAKVSQVETAVATRH